MLFANNNPASSYDALGLWPSSSPFIGVVLGGIPLTHQNANERALQRGLGVSAGDVFVLNNATVEMDKKHGAQDPGNSFTHAMRNGPSHQPDADARALANSFVRDNLSKAEDLLCNCGDPTSYLHALEFFGYALHTVQDSTSPAHNHKRATNGIHEFRRWYGELDIPNVLVHVVKENFDPVGRRLDKVTGEMWKYFQCKKTAPPFLPDFFIYGVDTRGGGYD